MKKRICVGIILILSLALLSGCGNIIGDSEAKNKKIDDTSSEVNATIAEDSSETDNIDIEKIKSKNKSESILENKAKNDSSKMCKTVSTTETTTESNTESLIKSDYSKSDIPVVQDYNSSQQDESCESDNNCSNDNDDSSSEQSAEQTTNQTEEQPEEQTTESPPQTTSYSPQNVVSLATSKCISGGMIRITDYLNQRLAEGGITQEEYDEYYPYDGLGYYSVFVETDLKSASTTSGRKLGSEQGIADYIADMLLLESEPYFLIEYGGESSGFYEFRCYR